jgi:hypothetical protein
LPLINLDKTDRVVEEAVQEAVDHQRWPTAYALRTLYDDHRSNPRIVRLIEAIYNGRASEANYVEFKGIMRQKKKEGKKDRTGEYYFNGDGSDPAPNAKATPPTPVIPALPLKLIQPPPPTPYVTPYRDMGPKSLSLVGRSASASSAPPVTASPNEAEHEHEHEHEHISKKRRPNSFQPVNAEVNGAPAAADEAAGAGSPLQANGGTNSAKSSPRKSRRARSQSTSSSLSSVDPDAFEGEDPMAGAGSSSVEAEAETETEAPAADAKAHAKANAHAQAHAQAHEGPSSLTRLGGHPLAGLGLGLGLGGAAKPHVSPYTSHNNFVAAASSAETLARNQAQPITAPPKKGPRIHTFHPPSVTPVPLALALPQPLPLPATPSPAALVAPSSSAKSPPITATSTSTTTTSAAHDSKSMAPAALLNSSSNSSAASFVHFPSSFKAKNLAKIKGDPYDANDKTSRLRRRARETTNTVAGDIRDSFERHQVHVASAQETDSDGGDSVVPSKVSSSKRAPKVRLLNKPKTRETRQRNNNNNNDDSEDLSSPTLLSFPPDGAPGSLSVSRAGTPSTFNRPTRKARTGTGLRVKTS